MSVTQPSTSAAKSPLTKDVQLSAILVMLEKFEGIRKTIRHLCAQTAIEALEIVIVVAHSNPEFVDARELEPAAAWQIVPVPELPTVASGWAAGIRQARAPLVVLCEDHSFPEPAWAQALIEAHRDNWSAVAPVMQNGNPETKISWANFLLSFSTGFQPMKAAPCPRAPDTIPATGGTPCSHTTQISRTG